MSSSSRIFTALRDAGFRLTNARSQIIELLLDTEAPLSVDECVSVLRRQKHMVDRVTVYRETAFLVSQGIANEIDFGDGVKRYEILPEGGHHHHLVCTSCNAVVDVDVETELAMIQRSLAKKSGFTITRHALEFFGTCRSCA